MRSKTTYFLFTAAKPDAVEAGVREWWVEARHDGEIFTLLGPFATLQRARDEIDERPVVIAERA